MIDDRERGGRGEVERERERAKEGEREMEVRIGISVCKSPFGRSAAAVLFKLQSRSLFRVRGD